MTTVVPAVLVKSEAEFAEKISRIELQELCPLWQVDVLDGSMFNTSCWSEPDIIARYTPLPAIELHLMTEYPLEHVRSWMSHVKNVKRAIFHLEVRDHPERIITELRANNLEVGIALNPETRLDAVAPCIGSIDLLLIMGVHPGASGQSFLGASILKKITEARKRFPTLTIAVDGGVTTENAQSILEAGANQLCAASMIWKSNNVREMIKNLNMKQ